MVSLPLVTLWVTALMALMSVPMAISVGLRRAKTGIMLLHGDDDVLLRRMRAHGNFIEYVPMALLALAAAELSGAPRGLLLACGGVLILGRLVHFFGLTASAESPGRFIGAGLTSLSIVVLAVAAMWRLALAG